MAFEEEFGIEIPDEDAEKITRVKEADRVHRVAQQEEVDDVARRPIEQASRRDGRRPGVAARHRHRRRTGRRSAPGRAASGRSRASTRRSSRRASRARSRASTRCSSSTRKTSRRWTSSSSSRSPPSQFAMDDARLEVTPEIADSRRRVHRVRASAGSARSSASTRRCSKGGPRRISPFFIPAAIINLAAGQVSIRFGAQGPEPRPPAPPAPRRRTRSARPSRSSGAATPT